MLNRNFTRRLTPWLTLYLLVASIGLPLQRVYCACVGEVSMALAGSEYNCELRSDEVGGHNQQKKACCSITETCLEPEISDHGCGHAEVIVAQFDMDFLAEISTDYFVSLPMGILPTGPVFHPLAARSVAKTRPIRGPSPPEHPDRRQLLVAHQTFLI